MTPARAIATSLALLQLCACAAIPVAAPYSDLRAGDHVDVFMADGSVRQFVVSSASGEVVCSESECLRTSETKRVHRRDDRMLPRVLAVVGVVILGAVLVYGIHAAGVAAAYSAAFR